MASLEFLATIKDIKGERYGLGNAMLVIGVYLPVLVYMAKLVQLDFDF